MGLISWILFGALAGWVASMIAGTNRQQGCLTDIIVGVVGAFLGGFIMQLATGTKIDFSFGIQSFVVAVLGAIILLLVLGANRRRHR